MPKRATPTDRPEIALDASQPVPLYKQLYGRVRRAILAGQLRPGARLPSTRTLAGELGISRSTTTLAYEQLLSEGFLESHVGRGTVVSRHVPVMAQRDQERRSRQATEVEGEVPELRLASHVGPLRAVPN